MNNTLYLIWMSSDKALSERRKKSISELMKMNINSVLINNQNLSDYITEPLHEGFSSLSHVHQADYMRCYLMHFYGGAYADIKPPSEDWSTYLEEMNSNENLWFVGSPHQNSTLFTGFSVQELEERNILYCADSGFLCKRQTPLTKEWYDSLIKKMDDNLKLLKEYPAQYAKHNYNVNYNGPQYPFDYREILDYILQPLMYKYTDKISRLLPALNCYDYL